MANAHMPEEFYDRVAHHLPPEQPAGKKGGRPRVANRVVLKVLWFVLATGNRREDVPPEMGCSGRTAHRRLRAREEAGIRDRLHSDLIRLLKEDGKLDTDVVVVDSAIVRAFGGGESTGPSPVDRGRPGTKHTLLVDRNGVPLAIRTAGANASDHTRIIPAVAEIPEAAGGDEDVPGELYADRGYESEATRSILRWLGIEPHIAKRKTAHGSGLGKVRWVVERTISWLKGPRRMRVRYDRLGVIRDAWATLSACVICFRLLTEAAS